LTTVGRADVPHWATTPLGAWCTITDFVTVRLTSAVYTWSAGWAASTAHALYLARRTISFLSRCKIASYERGCWQKKVEGACQTASQKDYEQSIHGLKFLPEL